MARKLGAKPMRPVRELRWKGGRAVLLPRFLEESIGAKFIRAKFIRAKP
jgi:hypothetical protein